MYNSCEWEESVRICCSRGRRRVNWVQYQAAEWSPFRDLFQERRCSSSATINFIKNYTVTNDLYIDNSKWLPRDSAQETSRVSNVVSTRSSFADIWTEDKIRGRVRERIKDLSQALIQRVSSSSRSSPEFIDCFHNHLLIAKSVESMSKIGIGTYETKVVHFWAVALKQDL